MRKVLSLLVLIAFAVCCSAQQPVAPDPAWQSVLALHPSTKIYVRSGGHTTRCLLQKVDDASLSCVAGIKQLSFPRTDIESIKRAHAGRSALVAAPIGYAAGTAIIAMNEIGSTGQYSKAATTVGVLLFLASPFIGYYTDFTRTTVYRREK